MEIIEEMLPKATLIDFHSCGRFHSASPAAGAFSGPGPFLTICRGIYEEVPQAATWGGTRVVNHFIQEPINDSRSEENPNTRFYFHR